MSSLLVEIQDRHWLVQEDATDTLITSTAMIAVWAITTIRHVCSSFPKRMSLKAIFKVDYSLYSG